MSEATLPNSVSTIPDGCFRNCEKLTKIQLGANVKKIGSSAFSNCQELIDVYCYTRELPEAGYGVFDGSYIEYATLHVPSSAVSTYKATEPWSKFKNVVSIAQSEYTLTYLVDGSIYKTYNIREGERIIPEPEPVKEGYTFLGWSDIPEYMPACDVTVSGSFINTTFVDGNIYSNNITVENVILTYTRTFIDTNWQALYVPFSMVYDDWKDNFDVAEINSLRDFDDDKDGVVDRTSLEVAYVKSGNIIPNTPYLIRSKFTGTRTITVANTTLCPAEENSIDCSSVKSKYTFKGTYTGVSGKDMINNGYYSLANGVLSKSTTLDSSLGTFRWYMKPDGRSGSAVVLPKEITVQVIGEENSENPTPAPNGECATPNIIVSGNKMTFECETPDAEFTSYLTASEEIFGNEVVIENKDRTYTLTVYATAPGYDRSKPATMKIIFKNGDMNLDGIVNLADITTLIKMIAGQK